MNPLQEKVAQMVEARTALILDLPATLELLKDQSLPLDDRWTAYTELVNNSVIVEDGSYGDGYLSELGPNFTQYDDFNNDRYNTVKFLDMYEQIMDAEDDSELGEIRSNGKLAKWQEKVLASGYATFTYDW